MRITFMSALLMLASAILPLQAVTAADTEVSVSVIQPDTDFSKYDKFMIQPLDIGETRLIPPPWIEGKAGKPRPWKISKKNADFMQQQYYDAMKNQLQELGGYTLVDEADDDVLSVEIEIVSLTPWASEKDAVITLGSGEMTFRAEIRDSMTWENLVVYEGDTPVGKDYQEFTAYSVDQNLNALFNQWGEFLREALNAEKQTAPSK
ncbi:MAG: DUF3313 family protein [Halieaceae bacterium]|jgi:hypothetical protein|nr:DUF3313 family protein [Halieaceae bacterium]